MNEQNFDLSIRADGYDLKQLLDLSIVGQREQEIISRLTSSAPILLEGIRGTGKTTLLQLAAAQTNQNAATAGQLAAYVSFNRYLLLENNRIPVTPRHPFTLWACAKILSAVYETAARVTQKTPTVSCLDPFFQVSFANVIANLEDTHTLQEGEASTIGRLPLPTQHALQIGRAHV